MHLPTKRLITTGTYSVRHTISLLCVTSGVICTSFTAVAPVKLEKLATFAVLMLSLF